MNNRTDFKKAYLIYCPSARYLRDDRCQAPVEEMTAQPARAPLDLAYMASMLEKEGVVCRIKDYSAEGTGWDEVKKDLEEFLPDILVISVTSSTMKDDIQACDIAKSVNPDILTISKGTQYLESEKELLEKYKNLDVILRGELQFTIVDLIRERDFSKILGISYKKDGNVYINSDRPALEDLDLLPFPARHLLNNKLYLAPDTKEPITVIYTGRGCPFYCIFCGVDVTTGHKLRARSPDNIVREIEECVTKYNIKTFFFRADTFTMRKDHVVKVCQLIIEKGLKIRWGTNSRVDTLDAEIVQWMKKAGCWIIGFGIESGNQDILDKMKKQITLEQARKAIGLCKEFKIKVYTLFLIGLPWDTKQTIEDSMRFAKELDGDFIDVNIVYPRPGTELYNIIENNNLFIDRDFCGHNYATPMVKTFTLSPEELVALRTKFLKTFYFRPSYILKTLLNINNPKTFLRYTAEALKLLKRLCK